MSGHRELRYLDASGSGLQDSDVSSLFMLVLLRLRHCSLTTVAGLTALPNLRTLDLSHNQLISMTDLSTLPNLQALWLDGNPFVPYHEPGAYASFPLVGQAVRSV